jgi:hypothetical protein
MKRIWTIIGVRDVPLSFKWYQSLFGQPKTAPAHGDWGQICDSDGTVLLCLHQWGSHEHPPLMSPDTALPGNGLLLFFRVDDFNPAVRSLRHSCRGPTTELLWLFLPFGYYWHGQTNSGVRHQIHEP